MKNKRKTKQSLKSIFAEGPRCSIPSSLDLVEPDLHHLLLLPPRHLRVTGGPRVRVPRVEEPGRILVPDCCSDHHYHTAG